MSNFLYLCVQKATESTVKGFNLHGSLLTQSLLKFGNPHPVTDSLMTLSQSELCNICCDASGSRVIEAFFESETVGDATRAQLYSKFKVGDVTTLSASQIHVLNHF